MTPPFQTDELNEAWNEWLLERKDRKLKKYTERGLKAAITHLKTISGNDEQVAVQIINQSISQNWQGLFPLKNQSNAINREIVTKRTGHQQLEQLMRERRGI